MPVFAKAKVRQVLGFDGARFVDPISEEDASLPLLSNDNKAVTMQMSSSFGDQGIDYEIGQDCMADKGCAMEMKDTTSETCSASATCTPRTTNGYTKAVPGAVFGFGNMDFAREGHVATFNFITPMPFVMEGEYEQSTSTGDDVRYLKYLPLGFNRMLHNCNSGPDAGADCDGPARTLKFDYEKPVYFSAPYFDNGFWSDQGSMQADGVTAPYAPEDRVVVTRCQSSVPWCTDTLKTQGRVYVEPDTGKFFDVQASLQLNVRIGAEEHLLGVHKVDDALVPVAIFTAKQKATKSQLADMVELQVETGKGWKYLFIGCTIGAVIAVIGALTCLIGFCMCFFAKDKGDDRSFGIFANESSSSEDDEPSLE